MAKPKLRFFSLSGGKDSIAKRYDSSTQFYEELSPLLHRIHAQHAEIKSQMQTLKRKQDEFDQITGNMKEALVLLDNTGRIVSINPAAKILFGAGSTCVGEDFLTIDRKQNMRLALEEAKTQGHADFCTKKNGREYQFDLSRIDSDGNHHGMVILAFDVTEQVNAEKHRQEFTANVSHELKTPLQSIIGSAELLENGILKAEDIPRFVGHIHKEASRLVFLIDDMIRLSELDEGAEMPHEDVSLKVLSEEVCEILADAANLTAMPPKFFQINKTQTFFENFSNNPLLRYSHKITRNNSNDKGEIQNG